MDEGEERCLAPACQLPVGEPPGDDEQPAGHAGALIVDAYRDECPDGGHAASQAEGLP